MAQALAVDKKRRRSAGAVVVAEASFATDPTRCSLYFTSASLQESWKDRQVEWLSRKANQVRLLLSRKHGKSGSKRDTDSDVTDHVVLSSTVEEMDALASYVEMEFDPSRRAFGVSGSSPGYVQLNEVLRTGTIERVSIDDDIASLSASARLAAEHLKHLIASAPATTMPMLVWRGVNPDDVLFDVASACYERKYVFDEVEKRASQADVEALRSASFLYTGVAPAAESPIFIERGFASTSAKVFGAASYGVVVEILVPAGSHVLYVGGVVPSWYNDEEEIVFGPGAQFAPLPDPEQCSTRMYTGALRTLETVPVFRVMFMGYTEKIDSM